MTETAHRQQELLPRPPTGRQVTIRYRDPAGDHEVSTVAVAAGLRSYTVAGRALLDGFGVTERPQGGRGQTLIPWPNRIADGRYKLDGIQQLALTEPLRDNAIHGLARWVAWQPTRIAENYVSWRHTVVPQPGWPTSLDCDVTYRVGADGLTVTTSVINVGDRRCFYGTGAHPYLTAGTDTINDAQLTVPAGQRIAVDDRGIPLWGARQSIPVDGTDSDFRAPTVLGSRVIDHAFGDLARDEQGRWLVRLTDPQGHGVELWADSSYRYLQLFTGDTLPDGYARRGLAVEPMTCLPDAFNATGQAATAGGVITLEPGDSHVAIWGARPSRGA